MTLAIFVWTLDSVMVVVIVVAVVVSMAVMVLVNLVQELWCKLCKWWKGKE